MKKEFGKWLMDIAKYITTAVILSSMIGDIREKGYLLFYCFHSRRCIAWMGIILG